MNQSSSPYRFPRKPCARVGVCLFGRMAWTYYAFTKDAIVYYEMIEYEIGLSAQIEWFDRA